jgi:CBS domain-containing protein
MTMTCKHIMTEARPVLQGDDSLEIGWHTLEKEKAHALAVVDGNGAYLGTFGLGDLLKVTLPRAASIQLGLSDLSFADETLGDLRRRLHGAGGKLIKDHLDKETPLVHPDMPILEAALLLAHGPSFVPVVEENSRRLLGIINAWDLVTELEREG